MEIVCYCGNKKKIYPYQVKLGLGKYCSRLCANKANARANSLSKMGKGNPLYGKVPWNKGKRYKLKSRDFTVSDNFCVDCGVRICRKAKRCRSCSSSIIAKNRHDEGEDWGRETRFYKGHEVWLGKHLSKEHKLKLSKAHAGLKHLSSESRKKFLVNGKKYRYKEGREHPNWQGGITSENGERLNKLSWKKIAKKVRKRDNYECQNKECRKRAYSVHHKIPWRISGDDSMNNLITLCSSCHLKADRAFNRRGVVLFGTQKRKS